MKYTPDLDELAMRILDYALLERVRCNKQTVLVLTGAPGEAKSSVAQALTEKLLARMVINYADYVNDVTVYAPFEFPQKEHALLYDKRLKDIPIMIIDEARLVVKAKNWRDFINQVITDVIALQRRVKRLLLIVVTQDLDDIDKDIRRLLTYWGEVYRPLHGPARVKFTCFWKDTHDPSSIKLKKRGLRGVIVLPNGKQRMDYPTKFSFCMPSSEVWNQYDRENLRVKGEIIKKRLNELIERIQKEVGEKDKRVRLLADYYLRKNRYQELLFFFRRTARGRYHLKKGSAEILHLDKREAKLFEKMVEEGLKKLFSDGKVGGGGKNGVPENSSQGQRARIPA